MIELDAHLALVLRAHMSPSPSLTSRSQEFSSSIRLGTVGISGEHLAIDRHRLIRAPELIERLALVDHRTGGLCAQKPLGCFTEPGDDLIVGI
jgi:hypothetical protein